MEGVQANLASAYRARAGQAQPGERGQDATMAEIVDLYARERLLGFELTPAAAQADGRLGRVAGPRVAEELPALATIRGRSGAPSHARCASCWPIWACPSSWSTRPRTATGRSGRETASNRRPAATRTPRARARARSSSRARRRPSATAAARTSPRSRPMASDSAERERQASRVARTTSTEEPRTNRPQFLPPGRRRRWPTRCSRPSSTRWSRSRSCAAPASSPACAPSSTSR